MTINQRFQLCVLVLAIGLGGLGVLGVQAVSGQEPPGPLPSTLTLEDCLALAQSRNRSIMAGRSRIDAARARARQVSISQLPTAQLQITDTTYKSPTSASNLDRQDAQRITLTESMQPFGRNLSLRRAAQAQIQVARADEDRTIIETGFQVTRTFYDILLANELIRVASDSMDQLGRQCERAKKLLEAGSAPRFDLLRAEVQLASARPALIRAIRTRDSALADLAQLLHGDLASDPTLIGTFPATAPDLPASEDEAVHRALAQRPDLASAIAAEEAARHQAEAARQALQPSLAMTGNLERARGSHVPAGDYFHNWSLGMSLQYPFFDSGLSRAQAREASANREQAQRQMESTLALLRADIRKARLALREAEEVITSQEMNVEQAQEALSIAQTAYETGAKTSLDVLDAQLALTQARTVYSQALHDRAIAIAQFEKSMGLVDPFVPAENYAERNLEPTP